ncbi:hypothetical protein DAPPUDRAFT_304284 [Daphnia pulex]|uniref:Peptidase S1 domain-containing protein n=1 Tax=Daphnia pulex TaxID=6669 RepID=E9GKV5_DAPPU|nr:hypothetical protein DAPPUDRAFT_304284 [Daphnia pulex]|eukprot:EFX79747.1 hypothetical protein DAPPUDRAFT_304284 [Daphnia pulex]
MKYLSAGSFHLCKFILIALCFGKRMSQHSQSFHTINDAIIIEADNTGDERQEHQSPLKNPILMTSLCPHLNELCCPKMPVNDTSNKPRFTRAIDNDKFSCGVSGPYATPNIMEGETGAIKNSWTGMVALVINNQQFCGGTLIDSMNVVTAAHCVSRLTSRNIANLRVALGMHTLKPKMDPQVLKKVRRVISHRDFNAETLHNDIALLTLESPVNFTNTISPVCLPPIHLADQYAYRDAVTIGWGRTVENGTQPNVLQQVTIRTITNNECSSTFRGVILSGITDQMLCAGYPGRGICSGDSGGPLFVQPAPGEKWIQVGIVSWGVGCAEPDFPGVYTRISSFIGWINEHAAVEGPP